MARTTHAIAKRPLRAALFETSNGGTFDHPHHGGYRFERRRGFFGEAFRIDTIAGRAATRDAFAISLPRALVAAAAEAPSIGIAIELTSWQRKRALQDTAHEVLAPLADWWQPHTFRAATRFNATAPSPYAAARTLRRRMENYGLGVLVGGAFATFCARIISEKLALGIITGALLIGAPCAALSTLPIPLALGAPEAAAAPLALPRDQPCSVSFSLNWKPLLRLEFSERGRVQTLINPRHRACSDALTTAFATTLNRTPRHSAWVDLYADYHWPHAA